LIGIRGRRHILIIFDSNLRQLPEGGGPDGPGSCAITGKPAPSEPARTKPRNHF
jgi:hypothetical protein